MSNNNNNNRWNWEVSGFQPRKSPADTRSLLLQLYRCDYSGSVAKMIVAGSGQLIKGILWCGDVTVERLKWGNEFLKKRSKSGKTEVNPQALKRMKR